MKAVTFGLTDGVVMFVVPFEAFGLGSPRPRPTAAQAALEIAKIARNVGVSGS